MSVWCAQEELGEDEAHRTEVGFGCLVGTCWGDVEKYHGVTTPSAHGLPKFSLSNTCLYYL